MHWIRERVDFKRSNRFWRLLLILYIGQAVLGSIVGGAAGIYSSRHYPPEVIERALEQAWSDFRG